MPTDQAPARGNTERTLLGLISLALVVVGIVGMITEPDPGWPGITLRSGIILAAIWLALPSLRRLRPRTWVAIGIPVMVLMVRPRLILWGALMGFAAWLVTRWKR